jgi:hypothetical protein
VILICRVYCNESTTYWVSSSPNIIKNFWIAIIVGSPKNSSDLNLKISLLMHGSDHYNLWLMRWLNHAAPTLSYNVIDVFRDCELTSLIDLFFLFLIPLDWIIDRRDIHTTSVSRLRLFIWICLSFNFRNLVLGKVDVVCCTTLRHCVVSSLK